MQQAIIFYAGWLGHYVADGSQPLHTTIQYNGWVGPNPNGYTTQHGIHAQFETAYVAANIKATDFAGLRQSPATSRRSVYRLYRIPKAIERAGRERLFARESRRLYGQRLSAAFDFTTHRLAAGSQMLLNLWYTAWLESAQPAPEHQAPAAAKK